VDVASTGQTLKVVKGKGNTRTYGFEDVGDISAHRILVGQHNARRVLEVKLTGLGAITKTIDIVPGIPALRISISRFLGETVRIANSSFGACYYFL
jgi:hypothetical protein